MKVCIVFNFSTPYIPSPVRRSITNILPLNTANAQFAKEAMAHQALDHGEILNVRWATVDPNPAAQKREVRRIEEQAAEAIRRALPAAYVAEIEGRDPEQKKRRKIEGSFGLEGYEAPDDVWYAKEKAEMQKLGAPQEKLMIESGSGDVVAEESAMPQQQQQESAPAGNGILSGSTLAALKGFKATAAPQKPAPVAGPLVGYGSDDDSD
jgi:hypothetical protein